MKLRIPESSVEYLVAEITSPDLIDPLWPVSLAAIPQGQRTPLVGDWETAEWSGSGVRLLIGPGTGLVLECGLYTVWVKIDAAPESAIRLAGTVEVI